MCWHRMKKAVNEYKGGKAASFNFLIGQCMRALRGKAPAAEVTKILKRNSWLSDKVQHLGYTISEVFFMHKKERPSPLQIRR